MNLCTRPSGPRHIRSAAAAVEARGCLVGVAVTLGLALPTRADVVVCDEATKPAPVFYAAAESRPVALAANGLARWLSEATGQEFAAIALAADKPLPELASSRR